ncbi:ABC transporter ATP-binding protein [Halobacillus massiliensis]|uniref:ABC transporter ATP-binding protein n=1 Tax=Halobacillus massiliensis TaxID=1926286 RepID=UPI0009E2EF56|nr:ABC transporter ATP-binding protein [Halobacillus massiliensis]
MKPIIEAQNLTLHYEETEKPVFKDLSLKIFKGETLLILGPSGSGKSSLIQCLNGLYPEELDGTMEGTVKIFHKFTTEYTSGELSRYVGIVFQDPETQFCMLTVEDEMAFGLENLQVPQEQMESIIETYLDLVGLLAFKQANITELSGGQKQKLALACVLAMKPSVLILDEPTANLDPTATTDFVNVLTRIQEKLGITLVVIEHQLDEWIHIIHRVYVMQKDGQTLYEGPLNEGVLLHSSQWQSEGIWMPYATRLALKKDILPLPLTLEELAPRLNEKQNRIEHTYKKGSLLMEANEIQWKDVITELDFQIGKGEFIAILGANGSGKTSLSRLLANITVPDHGEVKLLNKKLKSWNEADLREHIGYVFQNPEHQFITDSVYDEVAFSLRLDGKSEQEIDEIVLNTLKECLLDGLQHRHPFTLSQGQKRRLSVAVMIVKQQSILILDEPTFGQDAASTETLMTCLSEKFKQGTTIVMITHDMELVDQYATRAVVMGNGRIVFDESPQELWKRQHLKDYHLDLPPRVKLNQFIKQGDFRYVSS